MSEDFKKKLQQYRDGTLSEHEYESIEAELEKVEIYQQFLGEMMDEERNAPVLEKKLVKQGKKRSLVANVFSTVTLLFGVWIVGMILSGLYYGWNGMDRMENTQEALQVAIQTTLPNVQTESFATESTSPFRMRQRTHLIRQIGNDRIDLGELTAHYLFTRLNVVSELPLSMRSNSPSFMTPTGDPVEAEERFWNVEGAFIPLEQLPEGTMAELYLSFTQTMTMEELFELFRGRDLEINWMAVDIGSESGGFSTRIGIPGESYLLRSNFETVSSTSEGRITTNLSFISHPERFGDVAFRESEFLTALAIMQAHPSITRHFFRSPELTFDEAVEYIHKNGIYIYGAVVTGPRNDLLELRNEEWIAHAQVREVRFLNWGQLWE